jgi:histidine triad (HIT) family protein
MSLDGVYDPDNIFAKIARGDLPAAVVFEDAHTMAMMDVFPQSRGHTLVIHKSARARNILDVDATALGAIIETVQRIARAVCSALKPDGVLISQFNGSAAGQTIYHLHFHVIPRWNGEPLGRHAGGGVADGAELANLARQIADQIDKSGAAEGVTDRLAQKD